MTTVWYLSDDGADVVDGLRRVSTGLSVTAVGPEAATELQSADCVVTTPEAVRGGCCVPRALRAEGYDGPIVLFGTGSHETLAAAADRQGADTYVRRDVAGEDQPWHRLAEAVERVTTEVTRTERHQLALGVDRVVDLLTVEDDAAVAATLVETVSEATGEGVALVSVAPVEDQVGVHVVAATGRFDPTLLEGADVVNAVETGTELVTAEGEDHRTRSVVVVPVDAQRRLVVQGKIGVDDARAFALFATTAFDRARRVRALHRERDQLASLFENTSDAIADVEYVDGEPRVRDVNPAFERVFGLSHEDVVGTNLDDHVVPDGDDDSSETYRSHALAGEPYEQEVTRQTAVGPREFLLRSVPLSQEGSKRGYAIYTDITARKRTERTLGRLHEVTRDLIRAETQEAIADVTVEAVRDILGYPVTALRLYDSATGNLQLAATTEGTEEILGDRPADGPEVGIAWEAFHSGTPEIIDDLAAHGVTGVGITCAMYLPVGDRGLLTLGSPTSDRFSEADQRVAKILTTNVEVALTRAARNRVDRERERELARQNERLDAFASVVSHDLRNPLSVARGYLELARDACLDVTDEDPHPHFDRVERAHNRMNSLITDLLSLAREGEAVGVTTAVSVAEAARRAWATVDTKTATLEVVEDLQLQADAERLDTLFENLFRNAIEHGRSEGGDDIEVQVGPLTDGEGFYVDDNGIGIPTECRETVFERGYTTAKTGTGFGLSIVESIATAHGWTVDVSTGSSGGARFEVRGVER